MSSVLRTVPYYSPLLLAPRIPATSRSRVFSMNGGLVVLTLPGWLDRPRAALRSGRWPLFAILVLSSVGILFFGWRSRGEFWFGLSLEFGGGLAFFLSLQHINHKWLRPPVVTGLLTAAAACLPLAYFAGARLQAVLLAISSNIALFIALEVWLNETILKRVKIREKAYLDELEAVREWIKAGKEDRAWPWETAAIIQAERDRVDDLMGVHDWTTGWQPVQLGWKPPDPPDASP